TRGPLHGLRATASLLGNDLDHAVRRVCPVERRRGGALDHFDALDVVGIEEIESRAALERARPLDDATLDPYPVDIKDRRVPAAQRAGTADPYVRRGARLAAVGHHSQARDACDQLLVHG